MNNSMEKETFTLGPPTTCAGGKCVWPQTPFGASPKAQKRQGAWPKGAPKPTLISLTPNAQMPSFPLNEQVTTQVYMPAMPPTPSVEVDQEAAIAVTFQASYNAGGGGGAPPDGPPDNECTGTCPPVDTE